MKIQKTLNSLKTFLGITTFKWPRRFLLIVLMVPLVIVGFVTTICWLLRLLLLLVSYLFDGLNVLLIGILTGFLKRMPWIMCLHQTQTQFILLLTDSLANSIQRGKTLETLSISWIVLLERKLNRLLTKVIRISLHM